VQNHKNLYKNIEKHYFQEKQWKVMKNRTSPAVPGSPRQFPRQFPRQSPAVPGSFPGSPRQSPAVSPAVGGCFSIEERKRAQNMRSQRKKHNSVVKHMISL
jgi:hypothetical protein